MDRTLFVRLVVLDCCASPRSARNVCRPPRRTRARSGGSGRCSATGTRAQTADDRGAPNKIIDMGGTYYVGGQSAQATMRLPDSVATVERLIDGDIRTTLRNVTVKSWPACVFIARAQFVTDLDFNSIRMEETLPFHPTLVGWAPDVCAREGQADHTREPGVARAVRADARP